MPNNHASSDFTQKFKEVLSAFVPDTWTHVDNIDLGLPFLYRLKLIGASWSSLDDVATLMVEATRKGLIEINPQNKSQMRRTFK